MSQPVKILLTLSLLLNLLLAGIIGGHAGRYFISAPPQHALRHVADTLPEDKQDLFETLMDKAREDSKPVRAQLDEAHEKSLHLLKAEPFDKAAYLEQVHQINLLRTQMMQRMAESVAALAEQCTPEERALLAEALRRPSHQP